MSASAVPARRRRTASTRWLSSIVEETFGRAVSDHRPRAVLAAVHDRPFDVKAECEGCATWPQEVCLGPSTGAIVRPPRPAASPSRRLNTGSLVQLGYGSRQRRIQAAETDRTSAIAESIAQDKELTRSCWRRWRAGARGRPVDDADDAWAAAEEIGAPVVVKPRYGNQGRGVATNLTTREQVTAAYAGRAARKHATGPRREIRAGTRLPPAGRRRIAGGGRPPRTGTGRWRRPSHARRAGRMANPDPRRGEDHATVLSKISWMPSRWPCWPSKAYAPTRCRRRARSCLSAATPT